MKNLNFDSKGKVVIKNNIWANNFVQNQKKILNILSTKVSKVNIQEVSLDAYGRVVINNAKFTANIKKVIQDPKASQEIMEKINSLPRQV